MKVMKLAKKYHKISGNFVFLPMDCPLCLARWIKTTDKGHGEIWEHYSNKEKTLSFQREEKLNKRTKIKMDSDFSTVA